MAINRELEAEKYLGRVMETDEPGVYVVPNGRGRNYTVDLFNRSCSCPDYMFRGSFCKHLIAVETHDLARQEEIWTILKRNPGLRLIGNKSLTNADTSRWKAFDRQVHEGLKVYGR